jgi:hypothetical protein
MKTSFWYFLGLSSCATLKGGSETEARVPHHVQTTLVFHEETFEVAMPRKDFLTAFLNSPLQRFIQGTADLPGVDHTEPLTERRFPQVGSIRLVVLNDGATAHEEVLTCDENHLRYRVNNYTSEAAKPIEWGLGEFTFQSIGSNIPTESTRAAEKTSVTWRYSFKLRDDRFPGSLGALGRTLFSRLFFRSKYAPFMRAQIVEIQRLALERELIKP